MKINETGWRCCTCKIMVDHPLEEGQPITSVPVEKRRLDVRIRGCLVHDADAVDPDPKVPEDVEIEYECLTVSKDGKICLERLIGVDAGHAFEEASYMFEGKCIAVRRA